MSNIEYPLSIKGHVQYLKKYLEQLTERLCIDLSKSLQDDFPDCGMTFDFSMRFF